MINEGESFTIDGETYTQQSIGLVKGGEVAEGSEGNETFVYPGTWNVITQIGESGEIGLTSDTSVTFTSEDGSQVVAEYDSDGKLTAGTAADELDAIDVTEANKPVEIIGFDSDTTIKSGDTAFTANDDDADFTVDPTVEPAKVDNAGEINLTEGAVTVDGTDTAVIPNGDTDNTITPADSDTEIVVGSDGTISSIDNGDSFTVGDETYTQTPVGLIDSKGNILTSATDGTVTLADLDEAVEMVAVDSDGYIALSDLTGATAIIVDSVEAPTANYGTLSADDEGITVAATDYDAVSGVKTGSAGVYTVNGDTYVAVDIITINVTADATSLYNGTVEIDSSDETTAPASVVIGTKTVTALGTDLQVTAENGAAVSVADINVGEQFSVTENGETVTYTQAEVGLIRNDGKILDGSAIAADGAFTYTFDGTWSGVEVLDDTGAIAIDSDTSDIIYINSDMTAVAATYDSDTGTLTAGDAADEVQAVDVTNAGAEVGIVGFDSDTTIKSGDTQFTSTDDSVTVDPTTEPPTVTADAINLTAGDVSVGSDTEVTAGDYAVKPLGDTAITVDSDGTVSALDSGDSFTCNGSTYTMTPVGLVTDDNKLIESATDGTVTQSELADTVDMVAVDSNGYAPLDNIDASAVVVDSADAPTAIYGTITNSDGAYTVAVADSDTFTGVYTDNAGTFTVNGDEYAASTAVTVNVTASGTALREGVVTVAQAIDVADGGTVSVANDESGLPLWHCYQHY